MRKSIKLIPISLAMIVIAGIAIACCKKSPPIVDSTFNDDDCLIFSANDRGIAFDTGSDITVLYADTIPGSAFFFCHVTATDIHGDDIRLKKYLWLNPYSSHKEVLFQPVIILPQSFAPQGVNVLWGTDIINRSNWHIDFRQHLIDNQSSQLDSIADMIFHYKLVGNRWKTNIQLDSLFLKDILIDTGYTRSDFMLSKKQIDLLEAKFLWKDTCYNFRNDLSEITVYMLNECLVNGEKIDDISIAESQDNSIIGLPFFKRFSSVYMDTNKRMIFCYN